MTVSSTTNRVAYRGDGSSTAFAVPFYFLADADLQVYVGGTLQTINTDYTVSGAGNPAGGTVTFAAAPASGAGVVVLRDPAITQLTDYIENDDFPAESHERALDKLTMIAQRLDDRLDRAVALADSYAGAASPVLPTPAAGEFLGWNGDASGLRNYTRTEVATIAAFGDAIVDQFTGDGSTTAFTLSKDPGSQGNLLVTVGGVVQKNGTDFTWSPVAPTTLTFVLAPPNGEPIQVHYQQALPLGTTDASLTNYLPAGTGAVARTVQAKLRESVSVEDFGAVGDGVTDDSAAFTAAFAAALTVFGTPGKIYSVKDLVIDGRQFDGRGCGFRDAAGARWGIKLRGYRPQIRNCFWQDQGNYVSSTTLAAGIAGGATSVQVVSAAGIEVGDVLFITLDGGILKWQTVVTDVVGNVITFRDATPNAASAGNELIALTAQVWVEDAQWWTVSDVQGINTRGGLLLKPSTTASYSNFGTIQNYTAGDIRFFGVAKIENAAGVKANNLKLWGGWVEITNATGNGTAGPFTFPHPVFLLRDVTVTVGGVPKTRGIHWNFSSYTAITFTAGNEPATGAAIVIAHFRDGYRGFIEDQRNTAVISGGNCYSQTEILDAIIGLDCNQAELTEFQNLIIDTCSGIGLSIVDCTSASLKFGQTFIGFNNLNIDATGSNSLQFSDLYTALVPSSETYSPPTANIRLINSAVRVNAANWNGGSYDVTEVSGGRLDLIGAKEIPCFSGTTVPPGATAFMGPAGQAGGFISSAPGEVLKVTVRCGTPPGVGQTFTYRLNVNGFDAGPTLTISGDASNEASAVFVEGFSANAEIQIKLVTSAGAFQTQHRAIVVAK